MHVDHAIQSRKSVRRFLPTGVSPQVIRHILKVAARGQQLHTCTQAAFADFHEVVRRHLPLEENEILLCGIALGHEDSQASENWLQTERLAVEEFASFHGFREVLLENS